MQNMRGSVEFVSAMIAVPVQEGGRTGEARVQLGPEIAIARVPGQVGAHRAEVHVGKAADQALDRATGRDAALSAADQKASGRQSRHRLRQRQ